MPNHSIIEQQKTKDKDKNLKSIQRKMSDFFFKENETQRAEDSTAMNVLK